jgi:GNAT superfamily N-acetyltransferase
VTDVTVRRATVGDLDTVVTLRIALLREYDGHPIYGRLRSDAAQRARPLFAAQLESESEVMFLAEDDQRVPIGLIRCVETVASPLLVPDRYCYISSVYVKPDHRRQGVLHEMFARAHEWCRQRGLTEMRLHNVGSSESSAAAWDSLGFQVVEQVRVLRLGAKENAKRSVASLADAGRTTHVDTSGTAHGR